MTSTLTLILSPTLTLTLTEHQCDPDIGSQHDLDLDLIGQLVLGCGWANLTLMTTILIVEDGVLSSAA